MMQMFKERTVSIRDFFKYRKDSFHPINVYSPQINLTILKVKQDRSTIYYVYMITYYTYNVWLLLLIFEKGFLAQYTISGKVTKVKSQLRKGQPTVRYSFET